MRFEGLIKAWKCLPEMTLLHNGHFVTERASVWETLSL